MSEERREHVSERFRRMLALYRKPDGGEWGGQDLEKARCGSVGESGGEAGRAPDEALAAALKDETLAALLEESLELGARDRRLLLGIAR